MDNTPWSRFTADWQGKRVLVYGVGRQGGGVGVANTLAQAGAQVRIYDQLPPTQLASSLSRLIPTVSTAYTPGQLEYDWPQLVIKNPSVPTNHPDIQQWIQLGTPVLSEVALTLQYAAAQTIGITGTRGKTTTTYLIQAILQAAGWPTVMGGNIPQQPSLALLPSLPANGWLVLELSSFQLESLAAVTISPRYGIITNIYPDHLNRYANLQEYADAKANIFRWPPAANGQVWLGTHHAWYNHLRALVPTTSTLHTLTPATINQLATQFPHPQLLGSHNDENVALAAAVAQTLGIADPIIATAVANFAGVPFRLQTVRNINQLRIINDTTATTPTALAKALAALSHEKVVLICGGTTKNIPFTADLVQQIKEQPVATVWLPGSGTSELLPLLGSDYTANIANNLATAVTTAYTLAQQLSATVLLFSPGFSSFEMFNNEFDRGEQFNEVVSQLA